MRRPIVVTICAVTIVAFAGMDARGQSAPPSAKPSTPPPGKKTTAAKPMRTSWGDPDLQGLWNNSTQTPLQRPAALGAREFLTDEEIAEQAAEREKNFDKVETTGAYDYAWYDEGKLLKRTSLITDPPDGRLPPLTPAAEKARAARFQYMRAHPADSWEDLSPSTRCLTRGAPKNPGGYNNNFLIVQTQGQVAIVQEMIHEVRIIPLDRRPHLTSKVRQYLGDSRGHWEGDTLVVDTTNYNDKITGISFNCCPEAGANLHVIERFRRVDADNIEYSYTVDDPTTYTRSWSASVPLFKVAGPILEYACHEGNYGLAGILRGARADEAKRRAGAPSK